MITAMRFGSLSKIIELIRNHVPPCIRQLQFCKACSAETAAWMGVFNPMHLHRQHESYQIYRRNVTAVKSTYFNFGQLILLGCHVG